jgi:hypothetical protein
MEVIVGEALPVPKRLDVVLGLEAPVDSRLTWVLRGITSDERYVVREEMQNFRASFPTSPIGRRCVSAAGFYCDVKRAACVHSCGMCAF